ncbi:MAG: hypothetical protein PHX61_10260 [Alphaproteobacteria bacterium]|nr:hypothetical protein [Alphaproteobacteria bacterium]
MRLGHNPSQGTKNACAGFYGPNLKLGIKLSKLGQIFLTGAAQVRHAGETFNQYRFWKP